MNLWKGLDRNLTAKQKRKQVERAMKRLREAQEGRRSKLLIRLENHYRSLAKKEKQTKKGLHLTVQAYR